MIAGIGRKQNKTKHNLPGEVTSIGNTDGGKTVTMMKSAQLVKNQAVLS